MGGLCGNLVVEVLYHGPYPTIHWSTALGAALGAGAVVLGPRFPTIAVPVICLGAAALLSIAVFDRHSTLGFSFIGLSVAVEGIEEEDLRRVEAFVAVSQVNPSPRGCGTTEVHVTFDISSRRRFGLPLAKRKSVVAVVRPDDVRVTAFNNRGSGRLDGTVTEHLDSEAVAFTLPPLPRDEARSLDPEDTHVSVPLEIDGMARPRGVGTCFVHLPAITDGPDFGPSRPTDPEPALDVDETIPAKRAQVAMFGAPVLADESQPLPSARDSETEVTWRCDGGSDEVDADGTYHDCDAVGIVEASWVGPFRDLGLILIGALVSLAMEFLAASLRRQAD